MLGITEHVWFETKKIRASIVDARLFVYYANMTKFSYQRQKQFNRALRFVQEKHRRQFRAGGVPVWHHLVRVSRLLNICFENTKEGNARERFVVSLAALGHDLLEDTNAEEKETRDVFDDYGYELICGMTNRWGDKDVGLYVRQMRGAEEAVRIIKLADLYDNISNVTYNLKLLGLRWTHSYFLPIVEPMRKMIIKTRFGKYKKTANTLIFLVKGATRLLEYEIKNLEGGKRK